MKRSENDYKVYVCYINSDYEGSSIPLEAFDSEAKAKAWCEDQQSSKYHEARYEELEVK